MSNNSRVTLEMYNLLRTKQIIFHYMDSVQSQNIQTILCFQNIFWKKITWFIYNVMNCLNSYIIPFQVYFVNKMVSFVNILFINQNIFVVYKILSSNGPNRVNGLVIETFPGIKDLVIKQGWIIGYVLWVIWKSM